MTYPLTSFTSVPGQQDNGQAGMQQYIAQGQNAINPGQAQVAQSSPIAAGGMASLANAFRGAQQNQPPSAMGQNQAAMGVGAMQNPNVGGQNMGGVGPTPQNLALAQGLMQQQPPPNATQQFMNPQGS